MGSRRFPKLTSACRNTETTRASVLAAASATPSWAATVRRAACVTGYVFALPGAASLLVTALPSKSPRR